MLTTYKLYRQKDELLIAAGWTKHGCVDREGQITKIPPDLMTILKEVTSPPSSMVIF